MSMNTPPTVWKDGAFVDDPDHLAATGKPPVQVVDELGEDWQPMRVPDTHTGICDGFSNGVRERIREGRHEAQAWSLCSTDTETLLESPIYGLIIGADVQQFDMYDSSRPLPVAELTGHAAIARAERRAAIRATMKEDERSPLDMIFLAAQLRRDAQAKERLWRQQLEAFSEERKRDEEALALFHMVERGRKVAERERKQKSHDQ